MKKCMSCMREYADNLQSCPLCGYSEEQMHQDILDFPEAIPPKTILMGRYIIGRVLSMNDFSIVYMTWDALLQNRVVIREYLPFPLGIRQPGNLTIRCSSEQEQKYFDRGMELFEKEARLLNENQDVDGIVHVLRTFRENSTAYMVMEYIEGLTLQDLLDDLNPPGGRRLEEIMRRLGSVVDGFHARGIIHFNLTPENIFISDSGVVTVTDFSDAKREVFRILQRNGNMIDLRYAAPEVIEGESAGAKADMYSLGAICYRLQTGKEPPQSRTLKRKKTGLSGTGALSQVTEALTMPNPELRPVEARGLL